LALTTEKERLAVTLRSIGDAVITTDLSGKILLLNNVAERLTGWTHEEAIGKPLAAVLHLIDPRTRDRCGDSADALAAREDQPPVTRAALLVGRDLSERPIEEVSAPLCDETGRTIGLVVAFRDITEALKMREERARSDRVESLGLLAGGIAHDFNNILMAIMGNISLARASLSASNPAASFGRAS
jgi:PAS domain S-box-containing protein